MIMACGALCGLCGLIQFLVCPDIELPEGTTAVKPAAAESTRGLRY